MRNQYHLSLAIVGISSLDIGFLQKHVGNVISCVGSMKNLVPLLAVGYRCTVTVELHCCASFGAHGCCFGEHCNVSLNKYPDHCKKEPEDQKYLTLVENHSNDTYAVDENVA